SRTTPAITYRDPSDHDYGNHPRILAIRSECIDAACAVMTTTESEIALGLIVLATGKSSLRDLS
ncbi:MAG: hypothetical protein VYA84_11290, partial [Planctomycetota bacterium]|nr:hypothetical protein [Planctomycetota bacterium]